MSPNLFLKHLMILTDFGGEPLQRINKDFDEYFPNSKISINFDNRLIDYRFLALPCRGTLNNKKMLTDCDHINISTELTGFFKDIIVLLLYGGKCTDGRIKHIFSKCIICDICGNAERINNFIKQRYIYVSRITGGSQANDLGNNAQTYVENFLRHNLPESYIVRNTGHIPGVTQNNRTPTTFDLTVERHGRYVGVEISFQVTTNSTIERKAGQAESRQRDVHANGHWIAYILDGAGNFQRVSALQTICQYSDCTVAYTESEFNFLIQFIQEKLG